MAGSTGSFDLLRSRSGHPLASHRGDRSSNCGGDRAQPRPLKDAVGIIGSTAKHRRKARPEGDQRTGIGVIRRSDHPQVLPVVRRGDLFSLREKHPGGQQQQCLGPVLGYAAYCGVEIVRNALQFVARRSRVVQIFGGPAMINP